jgi:hypothetical protein
MIDWKAAYVGLHEAGYSDGQIAELANMSRYVVNRVRNGRYPRKKHEPGYSGGVKILAALDGAIRHGLLTEDPLNKKPGQRASIAGADRPRRRRGLDHE